MPHTLRFAQYEEDQVKPVHSMVQQCSRITGAFTLEICERFIPQFTHCNTKVTTLIDNAAALFVSILDAESNLLPEDIRQNWECSNRIYGLSRGYVYNIYKKFAKHYKKQS